MHTSLEEKPPGPLSWSEGSPLPTCRVRCRGAGASAGGGRALSISCCMRIWCTCALCISIISTMSEGRAPGGGQGVTQTAEDPALLGQSSRGADAVRPEPAESAGLQVPSGAFTLLESLAPLGHMVAQQCPCPNPQDL